jgi:hypothetical protein
VAAAGCTAWHGASNPTQQCFHPPPPPPPRLLLSVLQVALEEQGTKAALAWKWQQEVARLQEKLGKRSVELLAKEQELTKVKVQLKEVSERQERGRGDKWDGLCVCVELLAKGEQGERRGGGELLAKGGQAERRGRGGVAGLGPGQGPADKGGQTPGRGKRGSQASLTATPCPPLPIC